MATDDFNPKLGRIRSTPSRKSQRYLNRVIRNMRKTSRGRSSSKSSSFSGSRIGRGYSSGTALAMRSFQPGRRRVIIKARFTSFKRGGLGAAKAHLRYIHRDGVTREGERGSLYNADTDQIDGKAFLDRSEHDPHQFRIIVAPEDGAAFQDLKPFIRDLMRKAESDLGTKLDWAAVDHFNTGHPHTHIVIRGLDDQGDDLIIARDYISRGLRERACDLATLEFGQETEDSLQRKLSQEVDAERLTRIDRSILRDAEAGILAVSSQAGKDRRHHAHRMGRLRKLQSMGLAEELKPGVWKLADRTEQVLRDLGQRGDIMKTMQRVLNDAGIDRGASDYSVFDATKPDLKITGKIVAIGVSNELQDHHYVVVDGTDGKLHYAEIGRLSPYDPPSKYMVVTLRSQERAEQQGRARQITARLFIESHVPFSELATADGATWLDRKLLSRQSETYREKGFGAEANRALRLRQRWLVHEGLMTEKGGRMVAQRRLLATLTKRDISVTGSQLAEKLRMRHVNSSELGAANIKTIQSARMASGRFAVMQKGKEFALVPWRQVRRERKGKGLGIAVGSRISR